MSARIAAIAIMAGLMLTGCDLWLSPSARIARGQAAMAAGDYRTAIVQFKDALQSAPDLVDARLGLAEASLALADPATAAKELERAEALHAPAERLEPLKWRAALALGKFQDVEQNLRTSRPGLPESDRLRYRADALTALGQAEAAIPIYRELIASPQPPVAAHLGLARALLATGREAEALAGLDALLKADPASAPAQVVRGEILARKGNLAEADAAYAAALAHADARRDLPTFLAASVGSAELSIGLGHLDTAKSALGGLTQNAPGALVTRLLQARLALAEGRYDAAIEILDPIVARLPDHESALLMLGTANALGGHVAQAETHLGHAIALHPDNQTARRLLAQVQLSEGRADAAKATVAPLAEIANPDASTLRELGRVALATHEVPEAIKYLERAALLAPSDAGLKLELATAYTTAGRSQAALALLDQLPEAPTGEYRAELLRVYALPAAAQPAEVARFVAAHAQDPGAHNFAALFHAAHRDEAAARQEFEAALKIAPENDRALAGLARLEFERSHYDAAERAYRRLAALKDHALEADLGLAQIAGARGNDDDARQWLEKARAADRKAIAPRLLLARGYAGQGEYNKARSALEEALAIDPKRSEVLTTAAGVEERAGDQAKARSYIDRLTEGSPAAPEAWLVRGQYLAAHQDPPGARAALEKALSLRPDWPLAAASLAALDVREGNFPAALQAAARLAAKPGTRPSGLELRAEVEMAQGHYAAAVAAFDQAIALAPSTALVLHRYAAAERGHLPGAVPALKAWLAQHPGDLTVRFAYAEALQIAGDLPAAEREYEQIVTAAPTNPIPLNNLAYLYHVAGDARALETARKAYALGAKIPAVVDTLGWVLASSGNLGEGMPLLASAASAAPAERGIEYHYAWALAKTGKKDESKQILARILSNPEPFPERAEAQALAKEL